MPFWYEVVEDMARKKGTTKDTKSTKKETKRSAFTFMTVIHCIFRPLRVSWWSLWFNFSRRVTASYSSLPCKLPVIYQSFPLKTTILLFIALAMTCFHVDAGASDALATIVSADESLQRLMEGNKRFVRSESKHPHESSDYRVSLANAQHPFATILACSDSRVTPVLIFDQGVGDLFVIRVAGNIVDTDVTGSIEYAVDHLNTQLVVVMGHKNCGAVTAAYHAFAAHDLEGTEPDEINSLLQRIEPAVQDLDRSATVEQQIAQGIEKNVRVAIEKLSSYPDIRQSLDAGRLVIRGAIYDLETGQVDLLSE